MSSEATAAVKECFASQPAYDEAEAGVPSDYKKITRLGDLLGIHYRTVPVREQIKRNFLAHRIKNTGPYPGIVGFGDTVIPAIDRAVLAGHDMLLVGQAGQAKTLLARTLAATLLSAMPVVRGSVTNDCPLDLPQGHLAAALDGGDPPAGRPALHVSPDTLDAIRDGGLETSIEWRKGSDRYRYVLATPDLSVKDLVGHVDAVRVARRGTETYRIESYSPGQLMQAKHGLLCIDELPVLDPKKQVALLSVLQDGMFTTGAFPIAFEPRTLLVATANPVDYTHTGRIIEPLSDRLGSHIRTHYPRTPADEMAIMLGQARTVAGAAVMSEPVAMVVALALALMRSSPHIDQARGVSTRIGIHGTELLLAEAERARGMPAPAGCAGGHGDGRNGSAAAGRPLGDGCAPVPRLTDLHALWQTAKFDLAELDGTDENRREVFAEIVDEAVRTVAAEVLGKAGGGGDELEKVRAEFGGSNSGGGSGSGGGDAPAFRVSQYATWKGDAMSGAGGHCGRPASGPGSGGAQAGTRTPPYSEQLSSFPTLARMVERAAGAIMDRQEKMCSDAGLGGSMEAAPGGAADGDMRCLAAELLLEALRWSRPKILDRRDGRYVGA